MCNDDDINEAGGVHVILTYIPEDEAELVQIKGRTNR